MAKKKIETKVEKIEKACECPEVTKVTISPLTADFGREDLNTLRDKINEIINR